MPASFRIFETVGRLSPRSQPNRTSTAIRDFQDWVTKEVLPAIRQTGGYLLNEHARETAHADVRSAMPLPAEVMQVFQAMTKMIEQQTALMGQLVELMKGQAGDRANVVPINGPDFDREFYTAREVVTKLRLAGACPTNREFAAHCVRMGQRLSMKARELGATVRMDTRFQYPTKLYPKAVVEAVSEGMVGG